MDRKRCYGTEREGRTGRAGRAEWKGIKGKNQEKEKNFCVIYIKEGKKTKKRR